MAFKKTTKTFDLTREERDFLDGTSGAELSRSDELKERYTAIVQRLLEQSWDDYGMLKDLYLNYSPGVLSISIDVAKRLVEIGRTRPIWDQIDLQWMLPEGVLLVDPTSPEYQEYLIATRSISRWSQGHYLK